MRKLIAATLLICCSSLTMAQQPNYNLPNTAPSSDAMRSNTMRHAQLTIINEISVPAQEAGVLDELNFREGDLVEKGAVLGVIDKADAELAVEIAKNEYMAAKKTAENQLRIEAAAMAFEVAKAEYDASIDANKKTPNVIPKSDLRKQLMEAERAKMQAKLAFEELLIARHDAAAKYNQWQRAKAALKRRQILSRINGVVVKRNKHEGEWVQPGETVMRVVQMDRLRVEGDIDGNKIARHEVMNRPVKITVFLTGGGQEVVEGRIVYASSLVDLNEFTVRAEIDNRKITTADGRTTWLLTPGLKARMEIAGVGGGKDILGLSQVNPLGK